MVADNVLFNSPLTEYLDFVRNPLGPFESSRLEEGWIEYSAQHEGERDGMEISVLK